VIFFIDYIMANCCTGHYNYQPVSILPLPDAMMKMIQAFLLPLALIFAAIAVFDLGARYGAANTRSVALTSQLNHFVQLYQQIGPQADAQSLANLALVIDNHVMTAALQRDAWHLRFKQEPKASLDDALAHALLLRGEALMLRLNAPQTPTTGGEAVAASLSPARLAEIRNAVERAQADLITRKTPPELPVTAMP